MAHVCENCKFRARYDKKPDSMLGKFWRWQFLSWVEGIFHQSE